MEATKHTPGALRAARNIYKIQARQNFIPIRLDDMAAIIDRETQSPEMLKALEASCEALRDHLQYDNADDPPSLERIGYNKARAAIAKATPKE